MARGHDVGMVLALHALHAGIVVAGVCVVLFLLWPARSAQSRRVRGLRAAARDGTLIDYARARAAATLADRDLPSERSAGRHLGLVAVACVVAGSVHAFVGPEHFREGLRFGLFFVVLCAAQFAMAIGVLTRPSARLVETVALASVLVVALWIVTRTVALPFGLDVVEPVGLLDALSSTAEIVAAAACLAWLRTGGTPARRQFAAQPSTRRG